MDTETNTLHTIDEENHFEVKLEDVDYTEEGSANKYHSQCITRKATSEEVEYFNNLVKKANKKMLY